MDNIKVLEVKMKNSLINWIKLIAAALAVVAIIVMVAYSCVGPEVGV